MKPKERISLLIHERGIAHVAREEWQFLREQLPDVSETTLRKYLIQSKIPIEQPWRGVGTTSLEELEESLCGLTQIYKIDPQATRDVVIKAKDKARFASLNRKAELSKRALKTEMVEWMLVWLGDPMLFPDWVRLRQAVLRKQANPL